MKPMTAYKPYTESGISIADLLGLKVGDILPWIQRGEDRIYLEIRREKTETWYGTFLGRDAVVALKEYLKAWGFKSPGEMLFPRCESAIRKYLKRLGLRALGRPVAPHDLRKFFSSHMKLGAESFLVEYWMGHHVRGLQRVYWNTPWREQLKEYVKAKENISI